MKGRRDRGGREGWMEGRWKERRQEEGREKELKGEGKDEGKGRDGCSAVNCVHPSFPFPFIFATVIIIYAQ